VSARGFAPWWLALAASGAWPACETRENFAPPLPALTLPSGDPNGGAVAGTLEPDSRPLGDARLVLGAFDLHDQTLLAGVDAGRATFPFHYMIPQIPSGYCHVHALLDRPPYTAHPFSEPPGPEDAVGLYLNATNPVAVYVRPGAVTSAVDFFVVPP
jgi:hypothetical protein